MFKKSFVLLVLLIYGADIFALGGYSRGSKKIQYCFNNATDYQVYASVNWNYTKWKWSAQLSPNMERCTTLTYESGGYRNTRIRDVTIFNRSPEGRLPNGQSIYCVKTNLPDMKNFLITSVPVAEGWDQGQPRPRCRIKPRSLY